jgi:hypothetical protein
MAFLELFLDLGAGALAVPACIFNAFLHLGSLTAEAGTWRRSMLSRK